MGTHNGYSITLAGHFSDSDLSLSVFQLSEFQLFMKEWETATATI